MKSEVFEFDLLVIGCGIAGAAAALEASKAGLRVAVITQAREAEESNTRYAQGGIVTLGNNDVPGLLEEDIVQAGDGISNPEAVSILAAEGKALVDSILIRELKIPFSRNASNALEFAQEAGHSRRRILYVKDTTGQTIEECFIRALKKKRNITIFTEHTAVDLLTIPHHSRNAIAYYQEPRCIGAYVFNNRTGGVSLFVAPVTILATGGCGSVFLYTCNPKDSIGAGYAMALRAGARIVNMEYIQFHPTSLYNRDSGGFLISETVRGEGGRLKTRDGKTFMEKYTPKKDLAPRDEVTRAIYNEMLETNSNYVLLDLASYAKVDIRKRFPNIYRTCLEHGIDITKEPIPVVPAAHYCCGGVLVDGWGQTTLKGLLAVGEVSCTGLHGANRLASTSLLEGLVWGTRAARKLCDSFDGVRHFRLSDIHRWYYPKKEESIDPALIQQDWLTIRSTMWNYAGIIRNRKRLMRAMADLDYLHHRIEQFYKEARMDSKIVGLKHGIQVAQMITHAALANPVSRGTHFIAG